jgi:adenosylcobinamide kinase/adenosylcobinamide-phosphate guanylyltransferase
LAGLTLVLGGARSGKSAYAVDLARASGSPVLFVATGEPMDREMVARIRRHRRSRPSEWRTLEEPLEPVQRAIEEAHPSETIILDCLTIWVGNLLHRGTARADRPTASELSEVRRLVRRELSLLQRLRPWPTILISNEVGAGIVPESPLARAYRDLLGEVNQTLAHRADNVIYLVAGLPNRLKGN